MQSKKSWKISGERVIELTSIVVRGNQPKEGQGEEESSWQKNNSVPITRVSKAHPKDRMYQIAIVNMKLKG